MRAARRSGWAPAALARALWAASRPLATAFWALTAAAALLPAALAVGFGAVVAAIDGGHSLVGPLVLVGVSFTLLSTSGPLASQVAAILGDRTSGSLHQRLMAACSDPPGLAHLERPALADELSTARDFDLGITGPPLGVALGFVASGLAGLAGGLAQCALLLGFRWWAPFVLGGAWAATHWILRRSSVWHGRTDPEVMLEQRHADYSYRLAVDAGPAKELRVFGLGEWTTDRFARRRRRLVDLQWQAMRLSGWPLALTFALLGAAHALVLWTLASGAVDGDVSPARLVVFAQAVVGASALGVGNFAWALQGAAQPVPIIERLGTEMGAQGALAAPTSAAPPLPADGLPAHEVRFEGVSFTYPAGGAPVYDSLDLTIPAGRSVAIVGRNGAGKTTLVKLLCRLYDPGAGAILVDGHDLRDLDLESWRRRVTAVFQDFVRYELPLRANVVPGRGDLADDEVTDAVVAEALVTAGAQGLADLDQVLSKAYQGGTDLSGGQWQRIALARAMAAVRLGAGVVILDEPTAQLDVRGEAEIFERVLAATRGLTTVLISHRFSTVRHADEIIVLEHGRVVEQGSHHDLLARGGRYKEMFDLQAARFGPDGDQDIGDVLPAEGDDDDRP
jgi:ABC-type transport system involved in cytochrome bd biosynthesis fused ATPase/permease subunit